VVPVPQMLPELLAGRGDPSQQKPAEEASLLLLGDVDFDADPGPPVIKPVVPALGKLPKALPLEPEGRKGNQAEVARGVLPAEEWPRAARGNGSRDYDPLPGTAREIAGLADLFKNRWRREATVLQRGTATEAAFLAQAPRHRYLHLATHGFFAPSGL